MNDRIMTIIWFLKEEDCTYLCRVVFVLDPSKGFFLMDGNLTLEVDIQFRLDKAPPIAWRPQGIRLQYGMGKTHSGKLPREFSAHRRTQSSGSSINILLARI
jgi:hypothetical protein